MLVRYLKYLVTLILTEILLAIPIHTFKEPKTKKSSNIFVIAILSSNYNPIQLSTVIIIVNILFNRNSTRVFEKSPNERVKFFCD